MARLPRSRWAFDPRVSLTGLVVLAAVVRALVAARTVMPARDAATYLWIAEQVAAGHWSAAFDSVFHPLYSLLIAAVLSVMPGLGAFTAGQLVAGTFGAAAIVPLWRLTNRLFGPDAALAAGLLYALGVWFARHPAECLSEGVFYLLAITAVERLTRESRRDCVFAGLLAGLAYATRPEGAALGLVGLLWLGLRRAPAMALVFGVGFGCAALPWPIGWEALGPGFTLTPKLAFNWEVGAGGAASLWAHYGSHFGQLPFALLESVGYVAVPLAVFGLVKARLRWRDPAAVLVGLVAVQLAVIPLLRSHYRFLSGYGLLLLPLAGLGYCELRRRWCGLSRLSWALLVLMAFAGDLVRLPQARGTDRLVERDLGHWLRARLGPNESIGTEMPRLEYFAGVKPGPPRPILRPEILAAAASPRTRFIVLVRARTPVAEAELRDLGFEPVELPEGLRSAVEQRGLLVMRRR